MYLLGLANVEVAKEGFNDLNLETYNWKSIVSLSIFIVFILFRKEFHMIKNMWISATLVKMYP